MEEKLLPVGKISERNVCEPFLFKEIAWNIGDVSSLARCNETHVRSPEFAFAGGTWDLSVNEFRQLHNYLNFTLRRVQSLEEEQEVYWKLHLKTNSGKKLGDSMECFCYSAEENTYYVCIALPEPDDRQGVIAPDDALIAVCRMHTKKTVQSNSKKQVVRPFGSVLAEGNECHHSLVVKEITWKIPNFSSLPICISMQRSPQFSFENGSWILCMEFVYADVPNIKFMLRRLHSLETKHEVYYKFMLKSSYGEKHDDFMDVCHFEKNTDHNLRVKPLSTLDEMLRRSKTFTVVCQLHTSRTTAGRTCQVEDTRPSGTSFSLNAGLHTSKGSPVSIEASTQTDLKFVTSTQPGFPTDIATNQEADTGNETDDTAILIQKDITDNPSSSNQMSTGSQSGDTENCLTEDLAPFITSHFHTDADISLNDRDVEILAQILQFEYSGAMPELTPENANRLRHIAEKCGATDLMVLMSLDVDTMMSLVTDSTVRDIMRLAQLNGETGFLDLATRIYEEKVLAKNEWQIFNKDYMADAKQLRLETLERRRFVKSKKVVPNDFSENVYRKLVALTCHINNRDEGAYQ